MAMDAQQKAYPLKPVVEWSPAEGEQGILQAVVSGLHRFTLGV